MGRYVGVTCKNDEEMVRTEGRWIFGSRVGSDKNGGALLRARHGGTVWNMEKNLGSGCGGLLWWSLGYSSVSLIENRSGVNTGFRYRNIVGLHLG